MKTTLNFTLVNFQGHSCLLDYSDYRCHYPDHFWSFRQNMYVADLAIDGQIIGKAYCVWEACWEEVIDLTAEEVFHLTDWVYGLDYDHGGGIIWDKCRGNHVDTPETNLTLDGTNWYSVWHLYDVMVPSQPNWRSRAKVGEVTKRIGMSGRPREKVPHGSAEFLKVMKAYDRLTELVEAVMTKEPPTQS